MSKMDPKVVREWMAGYEAMNQFVDEERLRATPAERYQTLQQIWSLGRELHLFKPKLPDLDVCARWQRLREAYVRANGQLP